MLGLLRKKAKVFLWIIIFGVGIPFILWGTGAGRRGLASRRYIGEIYGRKVSAAEFYQERAALAVLALLRGERLPERALDTATWNRITLLEEAKRLGLTASPREIANAIRSIPPFMPGSQFSPEAYRWYLNNWRIMPAEFELMIADTILVNKLQTVVMSAVLISDNEVRDIYGEEHEKVSIRYALFSPSKAGEEIEVEEEKLNSYYTEQKEDFRIPERVSISYLTIEAEKPTAMPSSTGEELEQFYRDNPERFRHGKRIKMRQIFVKAPPEGDEKKIGTVESKLRAIKAKLEKGTSFEKLAKKYSDDDKTASSGGKLGYVEAAQLERKLSDAVFSLEAGEREGPIETESGYYFIKIEDVQEPGIKELGEVSDEIFEILKKEREIKATEEAEEQAGQKALALSLKLIDEPDLAKIAEESNLPLKTAGPFSREEVPDDLPGELAEAAFGMEVGEIGDALSMPGSGYAIITVSGREDERIPPLPEIRDKVIESYVASLIEKKTEEGAEESLERVKQLMEKEATDFAAACRELGIETAVSPPFSINGEVPELGRSMEVNVSAFSLPVGEPSTVFAVDKGFVFFAPKRLIKADLEPVNNMMERFKQRYLMQKRQLAWLEWFRKAQARAGALDSSSLEEEEEE